MLRRQSYVEKTVDVCIRWPIRRIEKFTSKHEKPESTEKTSFD